MGRVKLGIFLLGTAHILYVVRTQLASGLKHLGQGDSVEGANRFHFCIVRTGRNPLEQNSSFDPTQQNSPFNPPEQNSNFNHPERSLPSNLCQKHQSCSPSSSQEKKRVCRLASPSGTQYKSHKEIHAFCTCHSRCTAKKSCTCKKTGRVCSKQCHPGHGCTNVITPHVDSLEVDNSVLEEERSNKWIEVAGLYHEHKSILESSSWLDDIIVTTAQSILKRQYPYIGSL